MARGIRDAYREGGSLEGAMHLAKAGEIALGEVGDAAWHRMNCRDPSTHLTFPSASLRGVRFSVGRTISDCQNCQNRVIAKNLESGAECIGENT